MIPLHPRPLFLGIVVLLWHLGSSRAAAQDGIRLNASEGVPGQEITVDIYFDVTDQIECMGLTFEFDPTVLQFREIMQGRDFPEERRMNVLVTFGDSQARGDVNISSTWLLPFPVKEDVHVATIVFRVQATAEPGETAFLVHNVWTPLGQLAFSPPLSASISVLGGQGPRPPSDVSCSQDFCSILIVWRNTDDYSGVRITRNEQSVAELKGDATSWVDPAPPLGNLEYRVAALSGGLSSYGVICAIAYEGPVLKPPEDLRVVDLGTSVRLAWRSPVPYDSILVFRNRVLLAVLPGEARSFEDVEPAEDISVYAVAGVLEGIESVATFSLIRSAHPYRYRIPEIVVEAGRRNVRLPLLVTIRDATIGLEFSIHYDGSILEPFAFEPREALFDRFGQHFSPWGIDENVIKVGFVFFGTNNIQPLYNETVGWLNFNVRGNAVPGTPTSMVFGDSGAFGNVVYRLQDGDIVRIPVEILMDGEVLVYDPENPQEALPTFLECSSPDGRTVFIQWTLSGLADSVVLERDGMIIQVLDGSVSSYQDTAPGYGHHVYRVIARQGTREFSKSCDIFLGGPELFIRGDADGDGHFGLADVVAILLFLFGSPRFELPCLDAADIDDSGKISLVDVMLLLLGIFAHDGPSLSLVPVYDRTPDVLGCGKPQIP